MVVRGGGFVVLGFAGQSCVGVGGSEDLRTPHTYKPWLKKKYLSCTALLIISSIPSRPFGYDRV